MALKPQLLTDDFAVMLSVVIDLAARAAILEPEVQHAIPDSALYTTFLVLSPE